MTGLNTLILAVNGPANACQSIAVQVNGSPIAGSPFSSFPHTINTFSTNSIVLTATANAGYQVVGWSGPQYTGNNPASWTESVGNITETVTLTTATPINVTINQTGLALSSALGSNSISAGAIFPQTGIALSSALGNEIIDISPGCAGLQAQILDWDDIEDI